jgi:hypothetical protein
MNQFFNLLLYVADPVGALIAAYSHNSSSLQNL